MPANTKFGDACISEKHSNFFVNKGNATFNDMKRLINFVEESVFKKTGVNIEKEIKILENWKKILIISGGISKEREISLQTGSQVAKELKKNGYKIKTCEPDYELFNITKKYKPNLIFNALHGQYGEDGYIQSILENIGIPYTHSGVISSAKAMDKEISKKIFIENKILTPKFIKFSYDRSFSDLIKLIDKKLKFPVVIKPINEGSSVNVYICNKSNLKRRLKKLKFYKEILIEQFIPGREIQAAILGNIKLGAIELIPKRKFYDYEAKYNSKAKTKHIIPVDLTKKNLRN